MRINLKKEHKVLNLTKYISLLLSIFLFISCTSQNENDNKPNVILIMVDDQGYGDIASLGNEYIKTPNMDYLHDNSARFTQYHVSPTCAPTRAAIMTGHHSNRAGVWHTVNGRSLILERETTMAQIFKENGYSTGIFGKWHLGDNYPFRPEDKGFDEVLVHGGGGIEQTMDYWDNDYFDDTYIHNGKLKKFDGFCTDIWFENAKKYIGGNKDKPFFCYLSTNAAHSPYFVDDKYSDPYKDNENIPNAAFYGLLANVDENIGKLVEYLKAIELMDNTIIIFTTDNGTAAGAKMAKGEDRLDGFIGKGNNAGMRGVKASMYEGGHRVPLFIHWKDGGISTGKDINELTAHYDILPTLIDLCKLEASPELKFDGKSLTPLMTGNKEGFKDRIVITNSQRIENPEPWRRTALMQSNWRLINGEELYDLSSDPEQRSNIAEQHPEKMDELKTAYDEWWAEISPSYKDQPFIYIGHEAENPVKLYSHDWHTDAVASPWHQRHIRTGYKDNGYWLIRVAEKGKYSVKLRRWPVETKLALNAEAPIRPAKEGTSVRASKKGKALNITAARIAIQDLALSKEVDSNAEFTEFEVELEKGETHLKTWFTLEDKEELGAYFVIVEKL
ncbi:arylsulfatase [Arcticibacterium luteifluviistationis]|uniref:N-acetylgalactosamine-4-sulfatase n=1 Tax=Arcticibacterium luteifluviistationis TaxID=1784714 RepID=A0A2Z4G9C5_9BACT|nr:arylsulfatase [Arcticibacterium luteifluviistationis]AWV97658.1 N-acetylgalactosamine-4-sulfatase [Arcticibacterium luteifluviistationis]